MIELGLARVQALLQKTPQTWKAIHVAGTNGKGSICAYLTAMLRANGVSCASFTSPHLMDRWDCIAINDVPVLESKFRHFEQLVRERNDELQTGATEFELLTATAFEIFEAEKIEVGVVEVGLGGRLDATNAMSDKTVAVISKIGLDHQSFLGNSLEEIALQKAGIMRPGVPCVADASNHENVLEVLRTHGRSTGAPLTFSTPQRVPLVEALQADLEPHQAQNLATAYEAFKLAYPQFAQSADILVPAIRQTQWKGRLQQLDISPITSRREPVLLDGAHNAQSAEVLAHYVDRHIRAGHPPRPVTWILAASEGKDFVEISRILLRPGDSIVAVEFGAVDGMPWVKPMQAEAILKAAAQVELSSQHNAHRDIADALACAVKTAAGGGLVIAGSLYLVSDILKQLRNKAT